MAAKGLKPVDLLRATGAKSSSVNAWIHGKTKNLKGENLVVLARLLNVSEAWLASGTGSPDRVDSNSRQPVWPFEKWVPYSRVSALDPEDLGFVAAKIDSALNELESRNAVKRA